MYFFLFYTFYSNGFEIVALAFVSDTSASWKAESATQLVASLVVAVVANWIVNFIFCFIEINCD